MSKSALLIDSLDNVMVALEDLNIDAIIEGVKILEPIKRGHKIAIKDIAKDEHIIKYGSIIGRAKIKILKGCLVHSHNIETTLGAKNTYTYAPKEFELPETKGHTFEGYLRLDGRVGIRNDLYIIPLVGCVNASLRAVKEKLVAKDPSLKSIVKILEHPYGCSQLGDDLKNTRDILRGLALNPNAGGVMIVGLGCENNKLADFLEGFTPTDPLRFVHFNLQSIDDDQDYMVREALKLLGLMAKDKRVEVGLNKLILGLKCGGSDGFSGLTANPLVGKVSEEIGSAGGSIGLTEVPEMFGAEQQLMNRAINSTIFEKVVDLIDDFKGYYEKNNQVCYENPSPGNKEGGITTLEEKSCGCVLKGGKLPVRDVVDYGEKITKAGLTLVNGPGNDLVASTNLAASGCTLLVFTSGRGTPFGGVIPTVKIATNHELARRKKDWIDFDAEVVFEEGFDRPTQDLLELLIRIASGEKTKNEEHLSGDIAIFKSGVTL